MMHLRRLILCGFVCTTLVFCRLAFGADPPPLQGDLNGSGVLDNGDAMELVDHLLVRTPLDEPTLDLADANGDGSVNVADLLVMLRSANVQPPAVPVVTAPVPRTNLTTLRLKGTAQANVQIRITGAGTPTLGTASGAGTFDVPVSLGANRLNRLFVSAVGPTGLESRVTTVEVIQDAQKPMLLIDEPADTQPLTVDAIDVAGRVADVLSGFEGLDVTVNGQPALVNIGIGTNGSFLRAAVPLALGENELSVRAVDGAGNETIKTVTVTRIAPTGRRLTVVSGNGQSATVYQRLLAPAVVRVLDGDTPVSGQEVLFKVTRSSGVLFTSSNVSETGSRSLSVVTDANGYAQAWWSLGGDAGQGNNRMKVTGTGITGAVFFSASANHGPASQINIGSGHNQRVVTGGTTYEPLRAWVNDSCNGIAGVPVTFTVVQGEAGLDGNLATKSRTVTTAETGHAEANVILGSYGGQVVVEADFEGNPGAPASFTVLGIEPDRTKPTTFSGVVHDNAGCPIEGARCTLVVDSHDAFSVVSGADGTFAFTGLKPGHGHLYVDGLTATSVGGRAVPTGSYPSLNYEVVVIANAENGLGMPVLLPPLNPANAKTYDGTKDVVLTCAGMAGLKMTIKAGSMRRPDGSLPTPSDPAVVSLNQVHHDDIPMPMPDGAAPPFAWTLQPGGSTFDPPVEIEYPNMTGLPPGGVSNFLSFNHETGRFEIVASGTTSEDGALIKSDPDSGISVAGWGCNCPPYAATGGVRSVCRLAVVLFVGGTDLQDNIAQLAHNEVYYNKFQSIAAQARELDPDRVRTHVVRPSSFESIQVIQAQLWLLNLKNEDNEEPAVILLGHSLGGDTIRQSDAITAVKRFAVDPISRQLALNFPLQACLAYQRELSFPGPANTVCILADDVPFDKRNFCSTPGCDYLGGVGDCLRGYRISNAPSSLRPGTDHMTILDSAVPDLMVAVQNELGGNGKQQAKIAPAVIDSTWTIMVNGQSYQASDDGYFDIPNVTVPDTFGPEGPGSRADFIADDFSRITAVGKYKGETWYAYSQPFRVVQNETTVLTDLTYTKTPPPLPVSIRAVPDSPQLVGIGSTTQIRVSATLGDGSIVDVSPATSWTTYRTSNVGIAKVDPDGKVTAVNLGKAFITAINDGATSVCEVEVTTGDPGTTLQGRVLRPDGQPAVGASVSVVWATNQVVTGNDGTFSISGAPAYFGPLGLVCVLQEGGTSYFGLKPRIAPQAGGITTVGEITLQTLEDFLGPGAIDSDGDGLDDTFESGLGTQPLDADSDDDNIPDGQEDADGDGLTNQIEQILGSNPLHVDGDFDGFWDGDEYRYGTDPTNRDTDGDGLGDRLESRNGTDLLTPDSESPTVTFVVPQPNRILVRGESLRLAVDAHDDGKIVAVDYEADGSLVGTADGVPFRQPYKVPAGLSTLTLEAIARDSNGNSGTTGPQTYQVIADPFTLVTGRVLDQNLKPVAGVSATVRPGFTAVTQADGRFSIANVPTIFGSIVASASRTVGTQREDGRSPYRLPTRGGTTNVGDIVLRPIDLFYGLKHAVGSAPNQLATADFNGDGFQDLVVANTLESPDQNGDFSLFSGNGNGTLQPEVSIPVNASCRGVVAVDADLDGNLDLITARGIFNNQSALIACYPGRGDGTFGVARNSSFPILWTIVGSLVAGDMNRDGIPDIAMLLEAGEVLVAFGRGDGTFDTPQTYAIPGASGKLVLGDISSDGLPELVVTDPGTNSLIFLYNLGNGTFANAAPWVQPGSALHAVSLVDLNRDGNNDIVVTFQVAGQVGVLLAQGEGYFGPMSLYDINPYSEPMTITAGDLNDDDRSDVVVGNIGDGSVTVFLGNGDGTLQAGVDYSVGAVPEALAPVDLDGDGYPEIVSANAASNDIRVLANDGTGAYPRLPAPVTVGEDAYLVNVVSGDINGDGHADVLSPNSFKELSVLTGQGNGTFNPPTLVSLTATPWAVALAHLNGDAHVDLAYAGSIPNSTGILLGNGDGTFQADQSFPASFQPDRVLTPDLNGDGIDDIVGLSISDGAFFIRVNDGNGHLGPESLNPGTAGFRAATVGDVDGDGKTDLVLGGQGEPWGRSVLLYKGDGAGNLAAPTPLSLGTGIDRPTQIVLADVNNDSVVDIVVSTDLEGMGGGKRGAAKSREITGFRVFVGQGNGTFSADTLYPVNAHPSRLSVADINDDGFTDLLSLSQYSADVSIRLGLGASAFGAEQRFDVGDGAGSFATADANEDGKQDLLVGNAKTSGFHVFLQH